MVQILWLNLNVPFVVEHERHFAEWSELKNIGVPNEIMKYYIDKPYNDSLTFRQWYVGELETPIPTTFNEDMSLY